MPALASMTKKAIIEALNGTTAGQLLDFLPPLSELDPADAVRAQLALKVAAVIDEGGEEFTAALVKEFRATLNELEVSIGATDEAAAGFWSRMSAEMGNTPD